MEDKANINVPENRTLTGGNFDDFQIFHHDQPLNDQQEQLNIKNTKRQDLNLQSSRGFLVHNILSKEECQYYIQESERKGYVTIEKEFPKEYRNNLRYMGKSKALSSLLWKRLEHHFKNEEIEGVKPYGYDQDGIWIPLELDDCFTFGRYEPGGRFKPHLDATYAADPNKRSIYTMQVYLNDDYKGGKTNFYLPANPLEIDKHVLTESVQPVQGSAVIFNHDTLHEGAEVLEGRKYILRVDMMFIRIHTGLDLTEQQKKEMQMARDLFFQADSFEKDKGDLESAIKTYVKAQMMLAQYPSIDNTTTTTTTTSKTSTYVKQETTIYSIPEIVLFDILVSLPVNVIGRFRSTNKHFFKVLTKNQLWKKVYIKLYSYEAFKLEELNEKNQEQVPSSGKSTGVLGSLVKRFFKLKIVPENSKCWYLTVSNIYSLFKSDYMVADIGNYYIKYCNMQSAHQKDLARASVHYEYAPHYVMSSMDRETWRVGRYASTNYQVAVSQGLFDNSKIQCLFEIIWHSMSNFSKRMRRTAPILFILAPEQISQLNYLKVVKKKFGSEIMIAKDAALLTLLVHGLSSGTVLMLGEQTSYLVGYIDQKKVSLKKLSVAGLQCREYLLKRAKDAGGITHPKAKIFLKNNNEPLETYYNHCRVSMEFETESTRGGLADSLNILAPELLFQPSLNGIAGSGIVEETILFINENIANYKDLSNIVITGGNSQWPNFVERFTRDIKAAEPDATIYASPIEERIYDALKGAKLDHSLTKPIAATNIY